MTERASSSGRTQLAPLGIGGRGRAMPFTFAIFDPERVRHGVTRRDPALHREGDISFVTGRDERAVFTSRWAWGERLGIDAADIVAAQQVHGATVAHVGVADRGRGARRFADALPGVDALLTAAPGVPLLLTFADCTPLLFHDPVRGVAGLANAGWRGTVADIAGATIRAMVQRYGSAPQDILTGIGPAIGPCCYVVGPEVAAAWRALGVPDGAVARLLPPDAGR